MAKIDLDSLLNKVKTKKQHSSRPQRRRGKLRGLTILSNGLGRDSAAIIALLVQGKLRMDGGRKPVDPSEIDFAIFSDTGHEWAYSLAARARHDDPRGVQDARVIIDAVIPKLNDRVEIPAWMEYDSIEQIRRDYGDRLEPAIKAVLSREPDLNEWL